MAVGVQVCVAVCVSVMVWLGVIDGEAVVRPLDVPVREGVNVALGLDDVERVGAGVSEGVVIAD